LVVIRKLIQNRKFKIQIARLPEKAAMQGCRARLSGKAAGQGCRARLQGKAAECMVKLDNNAIF
jgi:hypothetical protein